MFTLLGLLARSNAHRATNGWTSRPLAAKPRTRAVIASDTEL